MKRQVQGVRNNPQSTNTSPHHPSVSHEMYPLDGGIHVHGYNMYGPVLPMQEWKVIHFMYGHLLHPNMHSGGNRPFANTYAPEYKPSGRSPPGTASGYAVSIVRAVEQQLRTLIGQKPQSHMRNIRQLWKLY